MGTSDIRVCGRLHLSVSPRWGETQVLKATGRMNQRARRILTVDGHLDRMMCGSKIRGGRLNQTGPRTNAGNPPGDG